MGDELIGVNTIQQLWVVEERLLERTKEQK
jgi:hypothetical protein